MIEARELSSNERGLAVVFGPPGPITTIAAVVLQAITEAALPECAVVEANSLHDWEMACSSGAHFIAISQYPSPEVCAYVECHAIPAIIVVDNPMHSLAHLSGNQYADVGAVRAVSASFSCLAGMLAQDHADIEASNAESMKQFFVRLAGVSGISTRDLDLERVELQASERTRELEHSCSSQSCASPPPSALSGLAKTVLPLADLGRPGNEARFEWPGSSFFLGDQPDTPMRGSLDLSGPARCVLYGPYLHLPAGGWNAGIIMELAGYDGPQSFAVEVVCGEVIAKGCFQSHGAGLLEVQLGFVHRDPHLPIEVRVFLGDGAIDGSLVSFGVSLRLKRDNERPTRAKTGRIPSRSVLADMLEPL